MLCYVMLCYVMLCYVMLYYNVGCAFHCLWEETVLQSIELQM